MIEILLPVYGNMRCNRHFGWFFFTVVFHVDKMVGVFFNKISIHKSFIIILIYQVKQKQALLGSNLSGINLMTEKKTDRITRGIKKHR